MKKCFKCQQEKPLIDFYKHPQMPDGHVNKCKFCNKKDVTENYFKKSLDPDVVKKERLRCIEKYKRLNYKEKQKVWDEKRPWKKEAILKNLSKKLKIDKGFECHHWNYNPDFFEDVFILEIKMHKKAHSFLTFDSNLRIFKNDKGEFLNTKTEHLNYLMSKNIEIKQF